MLTDPFYLSQNVRKIDAFLVEHNVLIEALKWL
jgi:hypothetical protein